MSEYDIIKAAVYTPTRAGWGIPAKIEGDVGTGKTAILTELAEAEGFHLEVMTLSLLESVEAQGFPYIDETKVANADGLVSKVKEMAYAIPAPFQRAARAARAIVYLDEMNAAEQRTFAAFMRVVNERHVGAFPLGPNVRFIASVNPIEVAAAAGGIMLPRAMNNRFCHLKGSAPSVRRWGSWLIGGEGAVDMSMDTPAEATEARVMDAWPAVFRRKSSEVLAYLESRPNVLNQQPKTDDIEAFPTPRSWDMLTRARASGEIFGLGLDDQIAFESGCIGAPAVNEFRAWVRMQDLPSAIEFLTGKVDFKVDSRRLDRSQAFMIACAVEWSALTTGKRNPELHRLAELFGEFATRRDALITPMGLLSSKNPIDIKGELLTIPPALKAIFTESSNFKKQV